MSIAPRHTLIGFVQFRGHITMWLACLGFYIGLGTCMSSFVATNTRVSDRCQSLLPTVINLS